MFLDELFPHALQLAVLELADSDAPPGVGGPDHRGVHELQHRPLAEKRVNGLGSPPLLFEMPLQEVGGGDDLAHTGWTREMRETRLEIRAKAPYGRGIRFLVALDPIIPQHSRQRRGGRLGRNPTRPGDHRRIRRPAPAPHGPAVPPPAP